MKQVYNEFAKEFNASRQNLWSELFEFKEFIKDNQKILDLGCGNGRLIELLKDCEIDYIGSDISLSLLNYAKKQDFGKIKSQEFIESDMTKLDFQENYFDIVFMIASFHHLENKKQRNELLIKINSWLKKDGLLIMTNWNLWEKRNLKKYFKYLFDLSTKKTFKDFIIPFKDNRGYILGKRFYHAFTLHELLKIAKNHHFKVIKNQYSKEKKNIITIVSKM